MAVDQALLHRLMELDDRERLEIAQVLLSAFDDDDDLDDAERGRLHAALQRSQEDIRAGRLHDARDVLAELRTRPRP